MFQDRPLIASVSGGKDSTAVILYLREKGMNFTPVFCDTGWEHPITYDYLNYLEKALDVDIVRVRNEKYFDVDEGGYVRMVKKDRFFPSQQTRTCTLRLKVKPIQDYLDDLRERTKLKPVNAVGIRKEESKARSALEEIEDKDEATIWRPLIDWSFDQVVDIHKRHNIKPNPLYTQGFSRVGCFPCIFARKGEIKMAFERYPERFDVIRGLEKHMQELTGVDDKYTFFNRGKIDDVIEWAKSDQLDLFSEEYLSGCLTWGLCDSGGNNNK